MEIGYQIEQKNNSKGGKVNSEIFRGIDNLFQLTFRTREIWELINDIFDNMGEHWHKKPEGQKV